MSKKRKKQDSVMHIASLSVIQDGRLIDLGTPESGQGAAGDSVS